MVVGPNRPDHSTASRSCGHGVGGVQEPGQQALPQLGHQRGVVGVVDEVAQLGRIVAQVVQLVALVQAVHVFVVRGAAHHRLGVIRLIVPGPAGRRAASRGRRAARWRRPPWRASRPGAGRPRRTRRRDGPPPRPRRSAAGCGRSGCSLDRCRPGRRGSRRRRSARPAPG